MVSNKVPHTCTFIWRIIVVATLQATIDKNRVAVDRNNREVNSVVKLKEMLEVELESCRGSRHWTVVKKVIKEIVKKVNKLISLLDESISQVLLSSIIQVVLPISISVCYSKTESD